MADDARTRAGKAAQQHFTGPDRDKTLKETQAKERSVQANKIAKLRALRLEKEAADREAAPTPPAAPTRRTRKSKKVFRSS